MGVSDKKLRTHANPSHMVEGRSLPVFVPHDRLSSVCGSFCAGGSDMVEV